MSSPLPTANIRRLPIDPASLFSGDLEVRERPDLSHCRQITVDVEYKRAAFPQSGSQQSVTFTVVAVSWLHWRMQQRQISMVQNQTLTVTFDFGPLPAGVMTEGGSLDIVNQYFVSADRYKEVRERDEENNGLLVFGSCVG